MRLLASRPSSLFLSAAGTSTSANAAPHRPSFVALRLAVCCLGTHRIAATTFLHLDCNCYRRLIAALRPFLSTSRASLRSLGAEPGQGHLSYDFFNKEIVRYV